MSESIQFPRDWNQETHVKNMTKTSDCMLFYVWNRLVVVQIISEEARQPGRHGGSHLIYNNHGLNCANFIQLMIEFSFSIKLLQFLRNQQNTIILRQ